MFTFSSPLKYLIYLILFITGQSIFGQDNNMNTQPSTVNNVDLKRYTGTWYEIAKIPNRFQKQCARNTTAAYSLNDDGTIKVINQCVKDDGTIDKAVGKARVVDTTTNAKLEVSFVSIFGFHLFWGDYWIIGLDDDYQYAVVGSPTRKYGWILCREKQMSEDMYNEVKQILLSQGYDPGEFEKTLHK